MPETAVSHLIGVQQAIEILDATPLHPRKIQLPLQEAAGLRLASDVVADRDYPPFDKALLDGFALRAADTSQASTTLSIVETIAAGAVARRSLGKQEAAAIMTGAPLPPGADAVVAIEQTSRQGNRVTLQQALRPGDAVARRGSDCAAGRIVLASGAILAPPAIAVAASVGFAKPLVFAPPTVAVLSTGDELIEIDQSPAGPQIRNSNSFMLLALLRQLGCNVQNLGIAPDNPAQIRTAMEEGLQTDALFITGGMSMGERDYVPQLMRDLNLDLKITKLRIKPGKPFVFATDEKRLAFGLPGNPVSAFVCTIRLASRILNRLQGGPPEANLLHAQLTEALPANGPREFYQPAILTASTIQPLKWNGSADIFTLAIANALIVRPENAPPAPAGQSATILQFRQ